MTTRISQAAALYILLGLVIILPALGRAQEQPPNQAGLIVLHGDGRLITACVSFSEPEISGLDLLDRAGLGYIAQSGGGGSAVCKLDGEGCDYPAEDCFCKCKGAECVYWAYQHLRGGKWSYSSIGAGAFRVKPGDVEGWAWGAGSVQNGAQPPTLTLDQICAAPAVVQPTQAPPTEVPPQPTQTPPTEVPPQPTQTPPTEVPTAAPAPTVAAAQPTAAPTALPTTAPATAVPTALPTAPAPTATTAATEVATVTAPTATRGPAGAAAPATPPPTGGSSSSTTSYLAFGAIALLLAGGIAAALRRRKTE